MVAETPRFNCFAISTVATLRAMLFNLAMSSAVHGRLITPDRETTNSSVDFVENLFIMHLKPASVGACFGIMVVQKLYK